MPLPHWPDRCTAAVFKLKEKNRTASDALDPRFDRQVNATRNKGVELEVKSSLISTLDLLAHYNWIDADAWRFALNVNNVADKTYVSTCLARGDCWHGARRNVVASATYRF